MFGTQLGFVLRDFVMISYMLGSGLAGEESNSGLLRSVSSPKLRQALRLQAEAVRERVQCAGHRVSSIRLMIHVCRGTGRNVLS